MKYKGKMKFVFTVDVLAETDDNISEMKVKQIEYDKYITDIVFRLKLGRKIKE